jgi:predicted metalloprotease with PDZ domain
MIALALSVAALTSTSPAPGLGAAGAIVLDVDAREISRRIVHTKMTIPAALLAGKSTLAYPKWIPGDHAPDGAIAGLVNLRFTANGKPVQWKRDPIEMFAFHLVDAPANADITASFDFVTPTDGGTFSGSTMGTENVGVVNFNQVVLVPEGMKSDDVTVSTTLRVPRDWQFGTALPVGQKNFDVVGFLPATLTTVIDSPVNMGRYFKRFAIDATHAVDVAAESEAALAIPDDVVTEWKQLFAEAGALFGARHYRRYELLISLSDHLDDFGLEHHESSDNRMAERALVDDDKRVYWSSLLAHEYAHSWNGKFRRPAGLATGDYQTPMNDEMLWAYEGLTQYLEVVLTARSGLNLEDEARSWIAIDAATMQLFGGRAWRPLGDTATFAQMLYGAPTQWTSLRRSIDFYDESVLLWLDVDTRIRKLSNGTKSLDDFLASFEGKALGENKPQLAPYTFDDLVKGLNETAPFDWAKFLREKIDVVHPSIDVDGLSASGWKLAASDEEPAILKAREEQRKQVDLRFSIGLLLSAEDNTIVDVIAGSAADKAGIAPGMKLDGVNGRKFSKEAMDDAIKSTSSPRTTAPIELLVENGEFYKTVKLDHRGGLLWPVLVPIAGKDSKANATDVLAQILAPKTPHAARAKKDKP